MVEAPDVSETSGISDVPPAVEPRALGVGIEMGSDSSPRAMRMRSRPVRAARAEECVRGDVHTNAAESLFKRSIVR